MNSLCIVYILYIFFSFCLEKNPKKSHDELGYVRTFLCHVIFYTVLSCFTKKLSLFEVFSIVQCLAKLFFVKTKKRQIILLDALLDFKYPSMCPTQWNAASCSIGSEISLTQHTNDFYCSFQHEIIP